MRKLASFPDAKFAHAVSDVLSSEHILSEVRSSPEAGHSIWIVTESDLDRARSLLDKFVAAPNAPEYRAAVMQGRRDRARTSTAAPRPTPRKPQPRTALWPRIVQHPVTTCLLVACIVVSIITQLGDQGDIVRLFTIVNYQNIDGIARWHGFEDLLHGQVWRLVTPIFLHFSFPHFLFNASWLIDLGARVERHQGSRMFAAFVVAVAILSNLAQLQFGGSPVFGGMSGVIYAFVGYLWARGRFDPLNAVFISPAVVNFLLFWLLLGFTGLLSGVFGNTANFCHLGGLVAGAFYGYLIARYGQKPVPH